MCETKGSKFSIVYEIFKQKNLSWEFENEHALWNWLYSMCRLHYYTVIVHYIYKQQKIYHGNLNHIVYECWELLFEIDYSISCVSITQVE